MNNLSIFYHPAEELFVDSDGMWCDSDGINYRTVFGPGSDTRRLREVLANATCKDFADVYTEFDLVQVYLEHPHPMGLDLENPIWRGSDFKNAYEAKDELTKRAGLIEGSMNSSNTSNANFCYYLTSNSTSGT